jgi:hypothetical protein
MNGGGGGGGLISLTYVSGNINGNLTAYGGLGGGTNQSIHSIFVFHDISSEKHALDTKYDCIFSYHLNYIKKNRRHISMMAAIESNQRL